MLKNSVTTFLGLVVSVKGTFNNEFHNLRSNNEFAQ